MPEIHARFATGQASRYLQQMCKHFAHKVEASFDAERGTVDFAPGPCVLKATEGALEITCNPAHDDGVQQMIFIIEAHLIRFAWREHVDLNWRDAGGKPVAKSARLTDGLAGERDKIAKRKVS